MKKQAKNTTIQNLTKQEKLSKEHVLPKHIVNHNQTIAFLQSLLTIPYSKEEIIFNIGLELVGENTNIFYNKFLSEYSYKKIAIKNAPKEEFDLLGAAYQFLNTKYENLSMGSFYTSRELAHEMTKDLTFDKNETLIDPSCGSGVFLFAADIPEDRIFGVDFDPIAVMIAKFNFFIKFPDAKLYPQIYQSDFIDWYLNNKNSRYTYIVGNPPYGANLDLSKLHSKYITTGESFSYFIEYSFYMLEENGLLSYLLPESILNVKRHVDIRDFILDKANLTKIKKYDTKFAGVMSDIYQIDLDEKKTKKMSFISSGKTYSIQKASFKELKNHIFTPLTKEDADIIHKVKTKSSNSLSGSTFALGVVTGDNAKKLLGAPNAKTEPIFTGKEIEKYSFLPVKKHIVFDRSNLQQVAPDAIYRAEEKIVYKVITKRIKVAIDVTKSLTSSSANIIIPNVPNNNVYSVAILLNSELYTFINQKLHGSVNKMSKENFEALPFPNFTKKQLSEIKNLIHQYSQGNLEESVLQNFVYTFFTITEKEKAYIQANIS